MYQVSTQIVRPPIADDNHFWIPLERTLQVIQQPGVSINPPSMLIVTHRRAFEHYKFVCNRNVTVLCVGERTRDYLTAQGFEHIVYHKSAQQILLDDRYNYFWLHGDKFKVNFRKEGIKYKENVVAIKTYSTETLLDNVKEITRVTPSIISVYSQGQYNLIESSGYIPDLLRVVPSVKMKKSEHWNQVEVFNPA